MRVSSIQMDVEFANPESNRLKVAKLVEEAMENNPDVILLPETWNVGFFPKNLHELSDNEGEPTISLMSGLAKKYAVNIVGGSIANKIGGKIYNTSYSFDREGKLIAQYNKIHLSTPTDEEKYFECGDKVCIFDIDGVKAGLIICYDLRFLELARTLALKGIQILFVPSHWPHPRSHHWRTLIMARAIENEMFVVSANGTGKAYDTQYCGNSLIVNAWGDILKDAGEGEKIITADLDLSIIKGIRERINVFRDRRTDVYEI